MFFPVNESKTIAYSTTIIQVSITLYGLAFASYIFYSGEVDKKLNSQPSTEEAIYIIKEEAVYNLLAITVLLMLTIFACFISLFTSGHTQGKSFLIFLPNLAMILFTLFLIQNIYLFIKLTSTKRIQNIFDDLAKNLSKKLNEDQGCNATNAGTNNTKNYEFIYKFMELEDLIRRIVELHYPNLKSEPSLAKLIKLVPINDNKTLRDNLLSLLRIRNIAVHNSKNMNIIDKPMLELLNECYAQLNKVHEDNSK